MGVASQKGMRVPRRWTQGLEWRIYKPRDTKGCWSPPGARTDPNSEEFYPEFQEERGPADALILDLRLPALRENGSLGLEPPHLWGSVRAALANSCRRHTHTMAVQEGGKERLHQSSGQFSGENPHGDPSRVFDVLLSTQFL